MSNTHDFRRALYDASVYSVQHPIEQERGFGTTLTSTGVPIQNYYMQPIYPARPSMLSTIFSLVIMAVIVYLAFKRPTELIALIRTYIYVVVALMGLLFLVFTMERLS